MKPLIITYKQNESPKVFRHLRDFCNYFKLKENTVCRWKFPKYIKRLDLTIYKENFTISNN